MNMLIGLKKNIIKQMSAIFCNPNTVRSQINEVFGHKKKILNVRKFHINEVFI